MNKKELLQDLTSKSFVKGISKPKFVQSEERFDGGKCYEVQVLEVVDKSAVYQTIQFYVIKEGTSEELAFYRGQEPESIILKQKEEKLI